MKRRPFLLAAFISIAAGTTFWATRFIQETMVRLPDKRLNFNCRNIGGEAALICPRFAVFFNGRKWGPDGQIGGTYKVDGRYGGFLPPDSDPWIENGVEMTTTYSAYGSHARERRFSCFQHTVVYRHFKNEVEVDGHRFSTRHFIALRADAHSVRVLDPDKPLPK